MKKIDSDLLAAQLNALAEVFDKKPVSLKGVEVWYDTLKDFPTERVMSVLIGWPRTHGKFPTPAEVWKICTEHMISDNEKKAREDARLNARREAFTPGVGGEQAEKFIAKMREILKRPKWTPMQHWQHVLETYAQDSIGHRYATEVLKKRGLLNVREPGSDDEPQAVNF